VRFCIILVQLRIFRARRTPDVERFPARPDCTADKGFGAWPGTPGPACAGLPPRTAGKKSTMDDYCDGRYLFLSVTSTIYFFSALN
jgi:hypothetical protein